MEKTSPYAELIAAENLWLQRVGWAPKGPDAWEEPPQVPEPRRVLVQGHAINSELLHGLGRGTLTAALCSELMQHRARYLVAKGWCALGDAEGSWLEPGVAGNEWRSRRGAYRFDRAVNRQKQLDRMALDLERRELAARPTSLEIDGCDGERRCPFFDGEQVHCGHPHAPSQAIGEAEGWQRYTELVVARSGYTADDQDCDPFPSWCPLKEKPILVTLVPRKKPKPPPAPPGEGVPF